MKNKSDVELVTSFPSSYQRNSEKFLFNGVLPDQV